MPLLLKLAWRNVFRNKWRTALACLAIGTGLASLMLADAWMIGSKNNMVQSATETLGDEDPSVGRQLLGSGDVIGETSHRKD